MKLYAAQEVSWRDILRDMLLSKWIIGPLSCRTRRRRGELIPSPSSGVSCPYALPSLANALKVCSTLSLIGTVGGEFFGGPHEALGVYILQKAAWFLVIPWHAGLTPASASAA